ncbi:hypothetical protein SAMN05428975_1728 [Mucilaginibacter sp. OK268]|nr:hypothetical protein SAMN05428975_1728 [Mucilaginibacter sp. OK268]
MKTALVSIVELISQTPVIKTIIMIQNPVMAGWY